MRPAANQFISISLAILLHGVVIGLLLWQGSLPKKTPAPPQQVLQTNTTKFDPKSQRQQQKNLQAEQERQRLAQEKRQQEKREQEKLAQEKREQEQKRQAEEARKEKALKEQALQEKAKQEAAEKKAAEKEAAQKLAIQRKKEQEEAAKTAAAQQRAEEERIQREIESRRAAEAEALRAQEEAVWQASEKARQEQADKDAQALADMESLMFEMISNFWTRPPGVDSSLETTLEVRLLGTGEILSIQVIASSGNQAFDASAIQAIEKAAPFPLRHLEPRQRDQFRRLTFIFTPEDLTW